MEVPDDILESKPTASHRATQAFENTPSPQGRDVFDRFSKRMADHEHLSCGIGSKTERGGEGYTQRHITDW